jgi:uncharacterized ferredoxin-like protein
MPYQKCACGCGRLLEPGKTGRNFASPACVLRVMQNDKRLVEALGDDAKEAFALALAWAERQEQQKGKPQ